jgi:coenzyme PQQ precursor peptide PqqA
VLQIKPLLDDSPLAFRPQSCAAYHTLVHMPRRNHGNSRCKLWTWTTRLLYFFCAKMGTARGPASHGGNDGGHTMKWVKPTIEELCIGLEINDYFPAEL